MLAIPLILSLAVLAERPDEAAAKPPARPPLEVSLLANAGFLARTTPGEGAGGAAVVFDAFIEEPYSLYAGLAPDLWRRMLAKEPPFARVPVALVTHRHADHFQPETARAFLRAHEETSLVAAPEVVALLPEALRDRARPLLPAPGEWAETRVGTVRVRAVPLKHSGARNAELQNLGLLVGVGGWKILHLGDADALPVHFEGLGLAEEEIDVALVPYWYYGSQAGLDVLRKHVRAEHEVAVHVPPKDVARVAELLAEEHPAVFVPRRPEDARRYE